MSETMKPQLSEEQVNELFKDCQLQFSSYYKYSFSFAGSLPEKNLTISVSYGGDSYDIYRYEVTRNKLVPFEGCSKWNYVQVQEGTEDIFSYSNYY